MVENPIADSESLDPLSHVRIGGYKKLAILSQLTVDQVVSGFILGKLGLVAPDMSLVVRDPGNTRYNPKLVRSTAPLYEGDLTNPDILDGIIDSQNFSGIENSRLKLLTHYLESLKSNKGIWWETRSRISKRRPAAIALNDMLSFTLAGYPDNPKLAYRKAQELLERMYPRTNTELEAINQVRLEVPVLKSRDNEPDRFETAHIEFRRPRILLLTQAHHAIVIGGSPHSGKSTLAHALCEEMDKVIYEASSDGILDPAGLRVAVCDLDASAPTSTYVRRGQTPLRRNGVSWSEEHVLEKQHQLRNDLISNNVVIADLPGRALAKTTLRLAAEGDSSILIDKLSGSKARPWKQLLLGANLPPQLVDIKSRQGEGLRSGLVRYQSFNRGRNDRLNLLEGRVANLDHQQHLDDDFIKLIAHVLLYDYLPSLEMRRIQHTGRLLSLAGES